MITKTIQTSIRIDPMQLTKLKHVAIDERLSLNALIAQILGDYLSKK